MLGLKKILINYFRIFLNPIFHFPDYYVCWVLSLKDGKQSLNSRSSEFVPGPALSSNSSFLTSTPRVAWTAASNQILGRQTNAEDGVIYIVSDEVAVEGMLKLTKIHI